MLHDAVEAITWLWERYASYIFPLFLFLFSFTGAYFAEGLPYISDLRYYVDIAISLITFPVPLLLDLFLEVIQFYEALAIASVTFAIFIPLLIVLYWYPKYMIDSGNKNILLLTIFAICVFSLAIWGYFYFVEEAGVIFFFIAIALFLIVLVHLCYYDWRMIGIFALLFVFFSQTGISLAAIGSAHYSAPVVSQSTERIQIARGFNVKAPKLRKSKGTSGKGAVRGKVPQRAMDVGVKSKSGFNNNYMGVKEYIGNVGRIIKKKTIEKRSKKAEKINKKTINEEHAKNISNRFKRRIHGNSKESTAAQHGYEIIDTKTGKVSKTGISSGKLNKDGSSPRANSQANKWNREPGNEGRYKPEVVQEIPEGDGARKKILKWEQKNAQRLRRELDPARHSRP